MSVWKSRWSNWPRDASSGRLNSSNRESHRKERFGIFSHESASSKSFVFECTDRFWGFLKPDRTPSPLVHVLLLGWPYSALCIRFVEDEDDKEAFSFQNVRIQINSRDVINLTTPYVRQSILHRKREQKSIEGWGMVEEMRKKPARRGGREGTTGNGYYSVASKRLRNTQTRP